MLAPSQSHSIQSNLPAPPPTPVKIVAKMLQNLSLEDETLSTIDEGDDDSDDSGPPSPSEAQMNRRRVIVTEAAREPAKTNLGYLVGNTAASSSSPMIHASSQTITPTSTSFDSLLNLQPKSTNEALLLAALRESQAQVQSLQQRVVELQASNILNEAYCNKLRFQLAAKESKKKGKGKGKLMGDGLPRMLTADEFYEKVAEFSEWKLNEEAKKEAQAEAREQWQAAVQEWEENEVRRKEENENIKARNKNALSVWQNSKKAATRLKKRFSQPKPTPEKVVSQPPKPRLKDFKCPEAAEGSVLDAGDDLGGSEGSSTETGSDDNQNDGSDESD